LTRYKFKDQEPLPSFFSFLVSTQFQSASYILSALDSKLFSAKVITSAHTANNRKIMIGRVSLKQKSIRACGLHYSASPPVVLDLI